MEDFVWMEGFCPDCGSELVIEELGGTADWFAQREPLAGCPYDQEEAEMVNVWGRQRTDDTVGSVQMRCDVCGSQFYAEQTPCGEWVM